MPNWAGAAWAWFTRPATSSGGRSRRLRSPNKPCEARPVLRRDCYLDRLVALKMILAGEYASTTDLARFRTEAEAIARLGHANIVQVYEVGEHKGKPYFAAGILRRRQPGPKACGTLLVPREAVALVTPPTSGV